ncbi:TetR/AcrR family transcriptional regulator [Massilia horti]|uniref:TetR/AcrR family transcriptional regulator n=2 Tax=Massilia horti TaxID=2562153 RepID=A0A4Y9SNF5_9BURK|nr:TetR/AcrR family transcriptional regulator [Massilia horti]
MAYNNGMSKREDNKQAVRERILTAAIQCFGDRDYASTTIDDVVAASGVARATVYANFAGKDELAAAAARRLLAGLFEHASASLAAETGIGQALALVGEQSAAWLRANRALAGRFFAYIAQQNDLSGVPAERPSIREALAQAFALAQARGELRADHSAGDLAEMFAYLWFKACARWTSDPDRFDIEGSLRRTVDVFLNGARAG